MRLAWLTDIHLNFVDAPAMQRFFESVAERADGGGEIKVLDNLRVLTGEAEYGKTRINSIMVVE